MLLTYGHTGGVSVVRFQRRNGIILVGVVLLAVLLGAGFLPAAAQITFDIPAESGILVDADTGQILWQKDAHKQLHPASLTKIMTMLLVMEAVDSGRASLDDVLTVSEYAKSMGGSQVYLQTGEKITLENIMKSIAIASGNDASVAAAEYIAGTEAAFTQLMNKRAQELGMRNTIFYNSSGLPEANGGNLTTAYDVAIMSRELLKHPKVLEWTSTRIDSIRDGKFTLYNTNNLLSVYEGLDGIKTGHTEEAGYCLAASAKRGDIRLISVVMRTNSPEERASQTTRLLDFGFNAFSPKLVVEENEEVAVIQLFNARKVNNPVVAAKPLCVLVPKADPNAVEKVFVPEKNLTAPLAAGTKVGTLQVNVAGNPAGEVPVVTAEDIPLANIFVRLFRRLWQLVVGLFS